MGHMEKEAMEEVVFEEGGGGRRREEKELEEKESEEEGSEEEERRIRNHNFHLEEIGNRCGEMAMILFTPIYTRSVKLFMGEIRLEGSLIHTIYIGSVIL